MKSTGSTLAQSAVTITIPTAVQKAMIPSSTEAASTSSSTRSLNNGTPAYYHNGQMYVLPSTSTTLRNLSVATFIDGFVSAVGESLINRVLIRKEDLAAFSVDVVATYPAIAAEYEKLCPRMLDLGTMKTNLTSPLPSTSAELEHLLSKNGDDAVVSEKYVALLLRKISSDISSITTSNKRTEGLAATASLPLVVAMFSACYTRVLAAKASSSSKGVVASRVSTRGRNLNSEDSGVSPTDSTAPAVGAVDEALLDACSEWLKSNVIEPITQRISDQVDLIAGNCLTFNASNTNTFFVDHAAELKTFTVQKALPAFRARWQDFLCSKWLRNSVVVGVIGELVKQYKDGGNVTPPNNNTAPSSSHEYLKPAPSALSQQFVETPPMTQNLSQKSNAAPSSSQPHKSLFKKGTTSASKAAEMPSVSLSAHFDSIQQQGGDHSRAATNAGPATTAQSRQERSRLLHAMSPSTQRSSTKTTAASVAPSPEAIFKVPEVLRSFLVAKHLHRGAIAAQLATSHSQYSKLSDLTQLFGTQSKYIIDRVGVNPYSVFMSSRKSASTPTPPTAGDDRLENNSIVAPIFTCDAALEKRFSSETVAQVLESFYCHRVAKLKHNSPSAVATSSSSRSEEKDDDAAPSSSFERAQALHNQTALRELRELLELFLSVFEKAVSMPVLLYGFEMSELYRSKWWAEAITANHNNSTSNINKEGASTVKVEEIGGKRAREENVFDANDAFQRVITPLSFIKARQETSTSWQFAQVCSCEYLVRLLVWLPQIVKVMLGGAGGITTGSAGGGAQWAAAALASQVVTPLVEELLEWIHKAEEE